MVLVYLMGIADIFAAFMLVTGLKTEFILYFAIAMLGLKGIASFCSKDFRLYIMGGADLFAIALLLFGSVLGQASALIVLIMLFKGIISFLEINLFRNFLVNAIFVSQTVLSHIKNSTLARKNIESKIFIKKPVSEERIYDFYFYNDNCTNKIN